MDDSPARRRSPTGAFAVCILAYGVALAAAVGTGYAVRDLNPFLVVFIADIAATLVVYVFSRAFGNASLYDPYWSVAPIVIAFYWALGTAWDWRRITVLVLVSVWGIRLTANWAAQWRGLNHEDWRYTDLRNRTGRWFWLVELVGIELMPTIVVFLGCLSLYPALTVDRSPGILDVIGGIVTAAAIIIEASADIQLRSYRRQDPKPVKTMDEGLWALSRHPNYFGEVLFWWGLYVLGLAAAPGYWWTVIGPVAITALFLFVSIPMMERRNLERRQDYDNYRQTTPAFIPRFSGVARTDSRDDARYKPR